MLGLLVVDMQVGVIHGQTRFDVDGVIRRINELTATMRASGGVVLYIQHEGKPGSPYEPGTTRWRILPDFDRQPEDPVIAKTACDAFYRTDLEDVLRELGIDQLLIAGCCTDFCIDTTVRAAASRDFAVTVVADAHTTADRPHLTAKKIIAHHNWVWANFILPERRVHVLPTEAILRDLP